MHAGHRNDVQKPGAVQSQIKASIFIEVALVPEHQRFHEGSGIRREDAVHLAGYRVIHPLRQAAQPIGAAKVNRL